MNPHVVRAEAILKAQANWYNGSNLSRATNTVMAPMVFDPQLWSSGDKLVPDLGSQLESLLDCVWQCERFESFITRMVSA